MKNDDNFTEYTPDTGVKSSLISKNVTVMRRRTSVRLEPEMWMALKDISMRESSSIHDLCSLVHVRKAPESSLTAAIRVFLMLYYRGAATEEGHQRAGHGSFSKMLNRAKVSTLVQQQNGNVSIDELPRSFTSKRHEEVQLAQAGA